MRRILAAAIAPILAGGLVSPVAGQATDQELRDEIEALKQGQERILEKLEALERALQTQQQRRRPSVPDVKDKVFDLGDNPVKGADSAKLTLVEFTDYQ